MGFKIQDGGDETDAFAKWQLGASRYPASGVATAPTAALDIPPPPVQLQCASLKY